MPEIPSCLLADLVGTQLDAITMDPTAPALTLQMSPTGATAACPLCSQTATRIHSFYRRTLADLPWAQVPVHLHLAVRRFFCDTPTCTRRIFTERLPTVAPPWARRTPRLAALQQQIGCLSG